MHVLLVTLCLAVALAQPAAAQDAEPPLSDERVVFQTSHGDIEFGFYPTIAPVTAAHIFQLCALGAYTSNHFFRRVPGVW